MENKITRNNRSMETDGWGLLLHLDVGQIRWADCHFNVTHNKLR